jgi:hypothetical protein
VYSVIVNISGVAGGGRVRRPTKIADIKFGFYFGVRRNQSSEALSLCKFSPLERRDLPVVSQHKISVTPC